MTKPAPLKCGLPSESEAIIEVLALGEDAALDGRNAG